MTFQLVNKDTEDLGPDPSPHRSPTAPWGLRGRRLNIWVFPLGWLHVSYQPAALGSRSERVSFHGDSEVEKGWRDRGLIGSLGFGEREEGLFSSEVKITTAGASRVSCSVGGRVNRGSVWRVDRGMMATQKSRVFGALCQTLVLK